MAILCVLELDVMYLSWEEKIHLLLIYSEMSLGRSYLRAGLSLGSSALPVSVSEAIEGEFLSSAALSNAAPKVKVASS